MSYICLIFLSVFLSSVNSPAEARHGDYSLVHHTGVWACNNCDKLGTTDRLTLPYSAFGKRQPSVRYPTLIWPALQPKTVP